ncbi:hypothetical protein NDU88_005812 [Pleurodeles waltl]|uniref:Uncharacterized protein n=1 Tax=Pleurodeles waltl TaxID=8319 RepID=A0AAV7NNF3_PLEWA|nr:hypothetical protein NDU88_005812 [Pleurodeles waltl]
MGLAGGLRPVGLVGAAPGPFPVAQGGRPTGGRVGPRPLRPWAREACLPRGCRCRQRRAGEGRSGRPLLQVASPWGRFAAAGAPGVTPAWTGAAGGLLTE